MYNVNTISIPSQLLHSWVGQFNRFELLFYVYEIDIFYDHVIDFLNNLTYKIINS